MGHSIHVAARVCLFFPKRRVISSVIFANPTAPTGTATDTAGVASVLLKILNSYFQPQARLIGEARPHGAILSLLRGRNLPRLRAWEAWQLRQRHRHSLTPIIRTLWVEGHHRRASIIVSKIPVNGQRGGVRGFAYIVLFSPPARRPEKNMEVAKAAAQSAILPTKAHVHVRPTTTTDDKADVGCCSGLHGLRKEKVDPCRR